MGAIIPPSEQPGTSRRIREDSQGVKVFDAIEARKAIKTLSEDDLRDLTAYAQWKLVGSGGTVMGNEARDLVQEAIVRTMNGARHFHPKRRPIKIHLMLCIKSLANGLYKRARLFSELTGEPISRQPDPRVVAEANLDADKLLTAVRNSLHDVGKLQVFDLLQEGYTPAEIKAMLRIADNIFAAAQKAIYRASRDVMKQMSESHE